MRMSTLLFGEGASFHDRGAGGEGGVRHLSGDLGRGVCGFTHEPVSKWRKNLQLFANHV